MTTPQSQTPRTNAVAIHSQAHGLEIVPANLARELERQLTQAQEDSRMLGWMLQNCAGTNEVAPGWFVCVYAVGNVAHVCGPKNTPRDAIRAAMQGEGQ